MNMWHYNDNGAQRGPISIDELKAKIAAGELSGTSLVWQVGTKDWKAVREFPELVTEIQTPPPLPKEATVVASVNQMTPAIIDLVPAVVVSAFTLGIGILIASDLIESNAGITSVLVLLALIGTVVLVFWLRPRASIAKPSQAWRRFFAKLVDVQLASLLGVMVVLAISPESSRSAIATFLFVALVTWMAFDVGLKGRTLGRYLFGIGISTEDGQDPSYLIRFWKLNCFGMALGIPVLSTVAMAMAYKRFRETGNTLWDEGQFAIIYQQRIGGKIIVGSMVLVLLVSIQAGIGMISRNDSRQYAGSRASSASVGSSVPSTKTAPADLNSYLEETQLEKQLQKLRRGTWEHPITKQSFSLPESWSYSESGKTPYYRFHYGQVRSIQFYILEFYQIEKADSPSKLVTPLGGKAVEVKNWTVVIRDEPDGQLMIRMQRPDREDSWILRIRPVVPKSAITEHCSIGRSLLAAAGLSLSDSEARKLFGGFCGDVPILKYSSLIPR